MAVREEIRNLILRAERRVLQSTIGELSTAEEARLRDNLDARIPPYTGRYAVLDLLTEMEAISEAGHVAAVAISGAIKRQQGIESSAWDADSGVLRAPITEQQGQAIEQSAREATEECFHEATKHFERNNHERATECLCSAIICTIAAAAALLGWPHQDRDDDLRVVVGLATGRLPAEGASIYKLLKSASDQGQDLNSAFAAAMGQPRAVRSGAYDDAGRTSEEVVQFARTAVDLADQLGRRLR